MSQEWVSNLFVAKGLLLWAGSWVTCGKITISDMPNCLNYCAVFIGYTQFTYMAEGGIVQRGRPWFGDPWSKI